MYDICETITKRGRLHDFVHVSITYDSMSTFKSLIKTPQQSEDFIEGY